VSRGYNARRKAKRQQARASLDSSPRRGSPRPRQLIPLLPVFAIVVALGAVAFLGFGSGNAVSREEAAEKVDALLEGLPQEGASLGSLEAPLTLQIFADLECPTVKRFAEAYLPSVIETWVRSGVMRLEYRSLQTDTINEDTFFEQEAAALAAGRQDRMWNFILTFLFEQGPEDTGYATDAFFTEIAGQVRGLERTKWRHDRRDALLLRRVALGVHSAHSMGMDSTPSFVISVAPGRTHQDFEGMDVQSVKEEVELSLRKVIASLGKEASGDIPTLVPES